MYKIISKYGANLFQEQARTTTCDSELKTLLQELKNSDQLVQIEDSVSKLIQILLKGKYSSGDHVDYYD